MTARRKKFNERAYRDALGNFATGVTVVTARDPGGFHVGVTANSFNSVSLDPPLVLWSLDRRSLSLPSFQTADYFVINVLAADQVALSRRFARRTDGGKFDRITFKEARGGAPLLDGCAAHFLCRKSFTHDGGDHLIFVGEVLDYKDHGRPALMFYRGRYAVPDQAPELQRKTANRLHSTRFVDDYLDYLLSHAAACFQAQFDSALQRAKVSRDEWNILCTLGDHGAGLTVENIHAVTLQRAATVARTLEPMLGEGWIRQGRGSGENSATFRLTRKGHDALVPLLAAAKAHESDALSHFPDADARQLKQMLKALMQARQPMRVRKHRVRRAMPKTQ
ncbi:MAG: hypothetical protein A3H91_05355 [Gammaproteobacteria bacterium RIFCSPLOWO2_02_FULL_61_13]|nr:MAG: hypothetical protein A3H91_05355 [Gammaproteobacteria bacterium RIFCSPLOWO2_02_FULL_61_13]